MEDIGLAHFSTAYHNPIKIALNGSIGLEVTPPEENSPGVVSSNTALVVNPQVGGSTLSLVQSGLPGSPLGQPLNLGINFNEPSPTQQTALPPSCVSADPQHLQGTIV